MSKIIKQLNEFPVIAALKDSASAKIACASKPGVCFILGGDIITAPGIIKKLREAGKSVFVHIDMINGMGTDKAAIEYVAKAWRPDGIITTRKNLIKCAKDQGLTTVQRIFLLDSTSVKSGITMINSAQPDIVEVVPGLIKKAIKEIRENIRQQVIAGGMITELSEVRNALEAGAKGISTSAKSIWNERVEMLTKSGDSV